MPVVRAKLKEADSSTRVLESIEQLKAKHGLVKQSSIELTSCIRRFESWVSTLPGRVETGTQVPDPDDKNYTLQLSVVREGKRWVVKYLYIPDDPPIDMDYTPASLAEAGVSAKLASLPHLPGLVESMVQSQDTLATRLAKATSAFNAFAASVGIPAKEDA